MKFRYSPMLQELPIVVFSPFLNQAFSSLVSRLSVALSLGLGMRFVPDGWEARHSSYNAFRFVGLSPLHTVVAHGFRVGPALLASLNRTNRTTTGFLVALVSVSLPNARDQRLGWRFVLSSSLNSLLALPRHP